MCFAIESRARIKANGGIKREIQNTKQIFIILEFWCEWGRKKLYILRTAGTCMQFLLGVQINIPFIVETFSLHPRN